MAELPHILLGAGGHGCVVLAAARAAGLHVQGVCDPALVREGAAQWEGCPVLGDDDWLEGIDPSSVLLLSGIGIVPDSDLRARLHRQWSSRGFKFALLVHPAAWVSPDAVLGDGAQIMAGAVIQPRCQIGISSIINTHASVDHDGRIGDFVHVAPGATLCGDVAVGDGTFIGAGATVINGVSIGAGALIAAGVTQRHALEASARAYGRREIKR
ncbi:MAG: acetyltransferase [Paracoccaceae bacterium]